jgi:hypothetical protein
MSEVDMDKMSDEELEAALDGVAQGRVPAEPVEVEQGEVEQSGAESVEQPVDESVDEQQSAVEKPETETAEDEPQPTREDELRAVIEEMEARAKKWESVAGRNAGELGYLKQQLRKMQEGQVRQVLQPQQQDDDSLLDDDEQPQRQPQRQSTSPKTRDNLTSYVVGNAIREAASQFASSHPDMGEFGEQLRAYIKDSGNNHEELLLMDDPIAAARETTRLLDEAYWHVRAEQASARKNEIAKRVAEQSTNVAKAKAKASVSGSGSAPPPKPAPKSVDDMTDDELEKALAEATKDVTW